LKHLCPQDEGVFFGANNLLSKPPTGFSPSQKNGSQSVALRGTSFLAHFSVLGAIYLMSGREISEKSAFFI